MEANSKTSSYDVNLEESMQHLSNYVNEFQNELNQKIKQLRKEKGGVNIELVLQIKIKEEQEKDKTKPKEYYDKVLQEITVGETGKLLENCIINMYRESYTEQEVDDLIRFYKTSAGKKMNTEFIFLIARSVKDAEQLMKMAMVKIDGR